MNQLHGYDNTDIYDNARLTLILAITYLIN